MVDRIYNPRYSIEGNQEDHGMTPAQAKKISKIPILISKLGMVLCASDPCHFIGRIEVGGKSALSKTEDST
jgi:hypothetical protein